MNEFNMNEFKDIKVNVLDGTNAFIPCADIDVLLVGITHPDWHAELAAKLRDMAVRVPDADTTPIVNLYVPCRYGYHSPEAALSWLRYTVRDATMAVFHLKAWAAVDILTFGLWMESPVTGTTIAFQPEVADMPQDVLHAASVLARDHYFMLCRSVDEVAGIIRDTVANAVADQ